METLWFGLVALLVAGYVVLDGFDLGAGVVHLYAARGDVERRRVLASIGPVWDGNEVWLIAVGGVLYCAFPAIYASSFSGFYLPLMVVLWLLILRGVSIEFRHQLGGPLWPPIWDTVFGLSSALLTVLFGAALGNVIRGVPLNAEGYFFLPLWTNFRPGAVPGILDWYTLVVGLTALAALTAHGALWVSLKTDGALQQRTRRLFALAWRAVAVLTALVTLATFEVQPYVPQRLRAEPWGLAFAALALAGLFAMRRFDRRREELRAFLASCAYLVGMLTSAVFGIYPYLLPSNVNLGDGLSATNSATSIYGLTVALYWFTPGMLLVAAYFTFVYRKMAGKVAADGGDH